MSAGTAISPLPSWVRLSLRLPPPGIRKQKGLISATPGGPRANSSYLCALLRPSWPQPHAVQVMVALQGPKPGPMGEALQGRCHSAWAIQKQPIVGRCTPHPPRKHDPLLLAPETSLWTVPQACQAPGPHVSLGILPRPHPTSQQRLLPPNSQNLSGTHSLLPSPWLPPGPVYTHLPPGPQSFSSEKRPKSLLWSLICPIAALPPYLPPAPLLTQPLRPPCFAATTSSISILSCGGLRTGCSPRGEHSSPGVPVAPSLSSFD